MLASLLPPRRPRSSARTVKCATSRYHWRDDARPALPAAITAIDIAITTPALGTGSPGRSRTRYTSAAQGTSTSIPPRPPAPPTRRQRITALMNSHPHRDRTGRELADHLQVKLHNILTQLAEWARLGFLANTGYGTYALNTPPTATSSTSAPDP